MPDPGTLLPSRFRRGAGFPLIIALLAVLPYLGGIRHDFVYDDHGQIVENPFLASSGRWPAVLTLQTVNDPAIINGRRPAVLLSYLADRALWGMEPAGWRISNYVFLGITTLLLYGLLARLTRRADEDRARNTFALVAALLFAWHPAMVEAVQVPAFRPDLLVALFGLLALHGALGLKAVARKPLDAQTAPRSVALHSANNGFSATGGRGSRRAAPLTQHGPELNNAIPGIGTVAHIVWILAAFWMALLSKESGVVIPFLMAWCWFCFPFTRPERRSMAGILAGCVLLIAAFAALCARPGPDSVLPPAFQAIGAEWNGRSLLFPDNLRTLPWLWWSYVRVLLLPIPLNVDRVIDPVPSPGTWRFIWGTLTLLGSAALGVAAYRKRLMWATFGVGIILAGFVPVSNIIPLLNPMAERYMPLMIAGFAILPARLLVRRRWQASRWNGWRTGILLVLLAAYFTAGALRVRDFKDDEALWSRTLRSEPRSARAHTWMGLIVQREGRLEEALDFFEKARELNPHDVSASINMAMTYGRRGDLDTSESLLREAIAIRPSHAPAHWFLAMTLQAQDRTDEALDMVHETLRLDPYHVDALRARIILLMNRGRHDEALRDAEQLEIMAPGDPHAAAVRAFLGQAQ